MTMSLLADGPADNSPDTVRRVPPVGIAISESVRQELSAEVKALETNLAEARLRWSRNPQQLKHWADIAIFGKSVDWALRYREIFKTNEVDSARLQLKTAAERLPALDKGQAPWAEDMCPGSMDPFNRSGWLFRKVGALTQADNGAWISGFMDGARLSASWLSSPTG